MLIDTTNWPMEACVETHCSSRGTPNAFKVNTWGSPVDRNEDLPLDTHAVFQNLQIIKSLVFAVDVFQPRKRSYLAVVGLLL
jgi:hypothetical protein